MDKHLLVTISEEKSALYGVRFVGRFFNKPDNVRLTLFASATQAPDMGEGLGWEGKLQAEESENLARIRSQEAVQRAVELLKGRGFPTEAMESKVVPRRFSRVTDIVQEAESGMYDAVVLGRRGLSRLEEALLEQSVSQGLLQETMTIPLWICRMPELNRQNVLACVDGSVPAYQAVDHAAFMLADEPLHELTLLGVEAAAPGSGQASDWSEIFVKCMDICKENGLDTSRVSTRVLHESAVAPAILAEAERGRYAAVAVGHSGKGRRLMGRFLFGSVSSELLRRLAGAALWVCR